MFACGGPVKGGSKRNRAVRDRFESSLQFGWGPIMKSFTTATFLFVFLFADTAVPADVKEAVRADWAAQYRKLTEELEGKDALAVRRGESPQVLDPQSLLRASDRDALDVIIRRTEALIADLQTEKKSGDLAGLKKQLADIKKRAAGLVERPDRQSCPVTGTAGDGGHAPYGGRPSSPTLSWTSTMFSSLPAESTTARPRTATTWSAPIMAYGSEGRRPLHSPGFQVGQTARSQFAARCALVANGPWQRQNPAFGRVHFARDVLRWQVGVFAFSRER